MPDSRRLTEKEDALLASLGENQNAAARLLGALALYRRDPPPALLVHPKSGLGVLWQMIEWNPSIRGDRQRRRDALRNGEFSVPGLSG